MVCGIAGAAAGGGTTLEGDAVARRWRDGHEAVLRAGLEGLADHHAGLGPFIGVLLAEHAGRDRAIALKDLVHVVKAVGAAPDVGAVADHDEPAPTPFR